MAKERPRARIESIPFVTKEGGWTISFSLFGWGFYLAWRWMGFSTSIIAPLQTSSGESDVLRLLALFTQAVALTALFYYFRYAREKGISGITLVKATSVLGVLALTTLVAAPCLGGNLSLVLLAIGWFLFGLCGALCSFLWLRLFSVVSIQELCLYVSGSLILGAAVVYVLCYLPAPVSLFVTGILPATSMAMSYFARAYIDYDARFKEQQALIFASRKKTPRTTKVMVVFAIYAFVFSALINPLSTRGGHGFEDGSSFMLLPSILAGILVIMLTWFSANMSNLNKIYQVVLSIMVVTLVVFPFVQDAPLNAAGALGCLGFELFNIICLVIVADSAEHEGAPKIRALTTSRIYYFWGMFFGNVASTYMVMNALYKDKETFTVLCLAAVVVLVISTTVFLGEAEILRKPEEEEAPVQHALVMPSAEDVFDYKARNIAERYSLTPREIEVFMLLSKGRSNKLIEERLVISEHTVDSHVTHIYRKCDVHSRQEIMDMIEQEHVDMEELSNTIAKRTAENNSSAE